MFTLHTEQVNIWITADGRAIDVRALTDHHIRNILRYWPFGLRSTTSSKRRAMLEAVGREAERRQIHLPTSWSIP